MTFEKELTTLINKHSLENDSDTPDYILAGYLVDCLKAYNRIVSVRKHGERKHFWGPTRPQRDYSYYSFTFVPGGYDSEGNPL